MQFHPDLSAATPEGHAPRDPLPIVFAVALGLAILLPFVNFLRIHPLGDFFSEWVCAIAIAIAGLAIGIRLPKKSRVNLYAFAIPALIVATAALQAALGKYSYAADWQFWLAYLFIAALALLMGQALSEPQFRGHLGARIAWAIILAGTANFLLQVLQAARVSGDLSPFVVSSGSVCQLFGNVGQANHANSLAWLGIGSTLYLLASGKVRPPVAALLLSLLLLSSAFTGSRMAWLFLVSTISLLAIRHVWPGLAARSRVFLAAALILGFVAASWGSAVVRHEIDPTCISGVARLANVGEGGNVVRLLLWSQAIRVWGENPLLGTGAGGFIGAVYRQDIGDGHQPLDSWVHNAPLQLLAEFGSIAVLGIALISLVLLVQLVRRRDELTPEDGLCLTGLAVIGIHSLFEFPLWYVQFLFLAALFLGVLTRPGFAARSASIPTRAIVTVMSAGVLLGAVVIFVDYRKLERLDFISELIQGIGTARVPEAQATLDEAAAQVRFFTQHRDYSVALARPLTREELESKIAVVDRSMSRMPNVNLIHVRILLAALDDDPVTARLHLRRAFKFHPQHTDSLVASLRSRIEAKPEEFSALTPILDEELARRPDRRW